MKKWLIAGMLVGTLVFAGCGGNDNYYKSSVSAIPEEVLDEFHDMYPAAQDVKWDMDNGLYQAKFELGNKDMKAVYTPDGDLVRVDS